ncbi:TonB-dependent receptor [Fibrisoma montanum]|uniref:TonB-dependent receptor n=2 Tax=Fibrisoma montanum TaxID=2305895 RepID=A0A418M174_9BACT|nr:TonB-dependent receptor [Fibrisoma montanum]
MNGVYPLHLAQKTTNRFYASICRYLGRPCLLHFLDWLTSSCFDSSTVWQSARAVPNSLIHRYTMHKLFIPLLLFSLAVPTLAQQLPAGRPDSTGSPRPNRSTIGTPGPALSTDEPRGNSKITGLLIDSTTNQPVQYATVALLNPQTGKPVDGTTADDKGRFTMAKVAPGQYKLQYSFIGYKALTGKTITIQRGDDLNVGTVRLSPDVRTLTEVNVVGQAALVEEKVDRLVFNADKDITARGGDATDIMRKVPLLSVDLDGNLSLRGSSNVRVLINGKPSTVVASSVADALKQIPADQIKTVEVITSPSARYDAEGSAGIINIVTKKNTLQGATLNVDAGGGNRGSNLGLNGNYRTGKMGFSLSGFGRAEYNVRGSFNNVQTTIGATGNTTVTQSASTLNQRMFGNYQLGWDYDIDKNTSLTASLRYGARNGISSQNNLITQTLGPTDFFPRLNGRNVDSKDLSGTIDANVAYVRTYQPQQELSVLGLFSRNNRTNNFTADLLSNVDFETIMARQRNDNVSYNQESTLQIDYQTPMGKNQLLEFGGKGILREVNSDYQYYYADGPSAPFVLDVTRPANTLNYNQNIAATYLSYTLTTKNRYTIKAGARYEYTFLDARFSNESGQSPTLPNYGNLVPSLNISKSLKGGKTIKLAYNRRLQRPGIQFLNPNVNAANPTNISVGNPYLSPELTDNLEFSASGNVKSVYLNASVFARRTNNEITSIRDTVTQGFGDPTNPVLQRVIRTSYQNVGLQNTYGVNLFANINLFSRLQLNGSVDAYHVTLTNNNPNPIYNARNSGWVLAGRLFSTVTLPNGWAIQAGGGMRGRQIQLQGYQGTFAFYNFGVKKDFAEKRGSIGLAAENFLNHPFMVRSEVSSPILSQSSVTSFYNAGVRLNISYRFGKMSFDSPKRRNRSVNNDDVKGGDGGSDNGAAQQSAPAGGGGRGRQ